MTTAATPPAVAVADVPARLVHLGHETGQDVQANQDHHHQGAALEAAK